MGICVETKHGDVVVTGDIKLIHEDGKVVVEERGQWEKVGQNKTYLLCDSTNSDRAGFSVAEARCSKHLKTSFVIVLDDHYWNFCFTI